MQRLLAAAVIVIAGLVTYANSFTGVFLFDDRAAIVDNPYVRNPEPWAHPWQAMRAPRNITVSGRPIASLSFALNYALAPMDARNTFDPPSPGSLTSPIRFERNAWGYHATNLAIHLLAALLLFGIVRRTLETPTMRALTGSGATPLAFLVALAWTVHPLQTGAVTYIVQRVESLMGMFMLLTLYCAIRSSEISAKRPPRRAHGLWALGAIVACALGMGTKEVMVGAPLIVALWDWTFLPGTIRTIAKRRWPLYLGLAATWIILGALVAMNARPLSSGFGFADWPWWRYLATQTGVLVHYLKLAFVPDPLVIDYSWPAAKHVSDIVLPGAFIVTLALGTLWQLARRTPLGFAGACVFVILAPSSSILPVITEIAAEHRMYLPLAALLAMVIVGANAALNRWAVKPRGRQAAFWVALVVITAYAWTTNARNADYMSDEHMWFDTIQKQPQNARARNNYASDLLATGQAKAAAEHLRVAVAESPDYAEAHANLGVALAMQGQHAEALVHLERALAINPFYTAVFQNIGEAYGTQHELAKAVKYFLKALDQRPDDVMLLNRAAWILATAVDPVARDGARAIVLAQHAVDLTAHRDVTSLDALGAAFAESGRFDEAIAAGSEALTLARARDDQQYPSELEQRLALYRARKPFRQ